MAATKKRGFTNQATLSSFGFGTKRPLSPSESGSSQDSGIAAGSDNRSTVQERFSNENSNNSILVQNVQNESSSMPEEGPYDIGRIIGTSLNDSEKYKYLTQHFSPSATYMFPKTVMHGKQRSFQHKWCVEYPWLVYSESLRGGLCKFCSLFGYSDSLGTLVTKPLTNWTKAKEILKEHCKKQYHMNALEKAQNFKITMETPEKSVRSKLDARCAARIEQNRKILGSIIETILVCGRQNIALRGHIEKIDDDTHNPGNFISLLKFRVNAGDTSLAEHLQFGGRNAQYHSPDIQNELIDIIGDQIRDNIIKDIKDAEYYSILGDEVTDVSNREVLSLVLRYIDKTQNIREDFLDFVPCERITGEALAKNILHKLVQWSLDIQACRGQGYDGASNMSSNVRGTQGLICQQNESAVYVHCNAHCLNLCIVSSCQHPEIRNMHDVLNQCCNFFNFSPKRNELLLKVVGRNYPEAKRVTLQSLCRTRWAMRHTAYEIFYDLFSCILIALHVISNGQQYADEYGEWNWDAETKTLANGILYSMENFRYIICFITVMKVLKFVQPLSVKLQNSAIDIINAYNMITTVEDSIKVARQEIETLFHSWYTEACSVSEKVNVQPEIPRTVGRQTHRSNTPASDPEEYYRRVIAIPMLDYLLEALAVKFSRTQQVVAKLMGLIPSVIKCNGGNINLDEVIDFYKKDIPSPQVIDVELLTWKTKWQNNQNPPDTAVEAFRACDASFFPNIYTLLKILCVIPVSSAQCERSFSALRRLKTYVRSTMGNERMSGLALMQIHYGAKVDTDKVIERFAAKHPRRMLLVNVMAQQQNEN